MGCLVRTGLATLLCALWLAQVAQSAFKPAPPETSGLNCYDKDQDDKFASNDGCYSCMCGDDGMTCKHNRCPRVPCPRRYRVADETGCCPTCPDGCYSKQFGFVEPGIKVVSKDGCMTCTCVSLPCLPCQGHWKDDGSCYGHWNVDKWRRNSGMDVVSKDGCMTCTCGKDGEMECVSLACLPCVGHWIDDGSCCGHCDERKCHVNGTVYEDGEDVPTESPCDSCFCVADGDVNEIMCISMMCAECPGLWTDDGTCCGDCQPNMCKHEGNMYEIGQEIDMKDACSMCFCEDMGEGADVVCMMYGCPMCPGHWVDDGTCCGHCIPGCLVGGQVYEIGAEVPADFPCAICGCSGDDEGPPYVTCVGVPCMSCPEGWELMDDENGCCGECVPVLTPMCDPAQCPSLDDCPENMRFNRSEVACCEECKCKHKRKNVLPGPFGDKCDGCVCSNGEVTCNPPSCPEQRLECVDAVRGEDCCYHCPNGKTCSNPRKKGGVIKYGEYFTSGGWYCTCAGEPWFPTAFCAKKKVPRSLRRKYGDQLVPYMGQN